MTDQIKRTRLEYIFDIYENDYKRAVSKKVYTNFTKAEGDTKNGEIYPLFYDDNFVKFYRSNYQDMGLKIEGDNPMIMMFNFFIECDPSMNKEYVSWFVNLYKYIIKRRFRKLNDPTIGDNFLDLEHSVFFEDLRSKVRDALETFSFLKKTNVLSLENRDINNFKVLSDFVNMVKPYTIIDDGDDSVHTLDHKELMCIQNFIEKNNKSGQAELVFENNNWVIVITHDKEANSHFGKFTTWCTAGTRYTSMFDSYHSRGELFVLIRKGHGSKAEIDKYPEYRLQFHFEDNMYMDALDSSININDFLFENKDIRDFFRTYIINKVIPYKTKKSTKQNEIIKYLLNLGYADQIIEILVKSKPEIIDFSNSKIEADYLNRLGEITSVKKLDLSDCDLSEIPESIKNLEKLTHIKIRNNKRLKKIPEWFSNLKKLEVIDCAGCDIVDINLNGCTELTELVLDFNPSLEILPNGITDLKKLIRLTASSCNLKSIDDGLLNCSNLFLLDVHSNPNLSYIPVGLSKLPNIVALCIDNTKIPMSVKTQMENDSNGSVVIIKYQD
jgi:Leucine-rich repeat (LRR) protein